MSAHRIDPTGQLDASPATRLVAATGSISANSSADMLHETPGYSANFQGGPAAPLLGEYEKLKRSHGALMKSYTAALDSLVRLHGERTDADSLAAWALQTSTIGWALIRQSYIQVTSLAFDQLERMTSGAEGWRAVPDSGDWDGTSHASLRALALAEAERLFSSDKALRPSRFTSGGVVVEMIIDHTSATAHSIAATLAVVQDVTRLARVEEEVAAMQRAVVQQQGMHLLGELGGGVAHDLQNLLGALTYRLAALAPKPHFEDAERANIDAMNRILTSCKALVAKLQNRAGAADLSPADADLATVIASAIEVAQSGLKRKGPRDRSIVIRTSLPTLPKVKGSPGDLRNLFLNLLLNAFAAMPSGGSVSISGAVVQDAVVVRVEDEGTGIPAWHLERIFDPFFSTKKEKGAGLGLALARETMTRAKGEITAHNRAGGGSCFELTFRRAEMSKGAKSGPRKRSAR